MFFMKLLTILLLMGLGLTGCQSQSAARSQTDQSMPPATLRVLTYNIHHGVGDDGKLDLQRIADVINAVKPDLVALQEVDKRVERSNHIDEPAVLAKLTGMHPVFEKNIDFQGGEYGNAILSRSPVIRHVNNKLPQSYADEQRGLLEAHIEHHGRPVIFYATHFDYRGDDTERLASSVMLKDLIEQQSTQTIIVAGDLNTRPDTAVMKKLRKFLVDTHNEENGPGYTFPADNPDRRIDYIMHTPRAGLKVIESRVIDEPVASDHRPLLVVYEMTND